MLSFLRFGFLVLIVIRVFIIGARGRYSAPTRPCFADGRQLFFDVQRDDKYSTIDGVRMAVPVARGLEFMLRPETRFDHVAKIVGLASEWQTGDREFDGRVFIVSEERALHEALSLDSALRKLVGALISQRKQWRLRCVNGWLEVSYSGRLAYDFEVPDEKIADDFAKEVGATLLELARRIEPLVAQIDESKHDSRDWGMAGVAVLCLALGLSGALGFVYSYVTGENYQVVFAQTHRLATWFASAVGVLLLGAVFLWLRGTSRSHGVLLDVLFAGIPGAWFAACGFASWYNLHMDHGAARAQAVHVERTFSRKGRHSTSYYVLVRAWPDPRGEREVEVTQYDYQQARSASCVLALWHDGALGDGWISGLEAPEENVCDVGELERY